MARPISKTTASSNKLGRGANAVDKTQKGLSRERIEADMAAFRKAGGRIEVLGTTRVLKKVGELEAG
ncbi:hypothetical protein [Xanthomonas albilineans]|uniref:Uncharacterized protein n=1 Tax=Xanthomonas albilineans (strain GPE PC73 / CFBP 7063) TaxID=380358 RepID=D2U9N7_XANAP|nr:hypothetical protein [Xanthomonas albilineans]PPU93552.1 hypothetical protein XalbCFBP2523_06520 [Xanthomonas albilineans]QHQ29226.1 hypothetical protein XaFJ1_GM002513 [Xanthomonas albilineans]CBA16989.1 hypothetical protein XALC_2510 [Xanthomonas albilineans GPE PC73]